MAIENVKDSALTRKTTPVSSDLVRIVSAPGTLPVSQTTTLGNLTKGLDPTNFPPSGTLGQIWTSNGPSTPPSMQAAPAGTVPVSGTSKTAILGGNGAAAWEVKEIGQVAAHLLTPKQAAQGVNVTDAASGSSGITVADNAQIDFGTGNFALVWRGALPDWTLATAPYLMSKYSYTSAILNAGFAFRIDSTGHPFIQLFLNSTGELKSTAAVSFTDGSVHELVAVVTRETASAVGSIVFYADGAQLGTTVELAIVNPPIAVSNATAFQIAGAGATRTASTTHAALLLNFAPTAAEVKQLYDTQTVPESWKWGSQTQIITNGTFGSDVAGWTAGGAATITWDGVGAADLAGFATVNTDYVQQTAILGIADNKRVDFSATISGTNAGTAVVKIRVDNVRTVLNGAVGDLLLGTVADGVITGTFYGSTSTQTIKFMTTTSGTEKTFTVDDITLKLVGPTAAYFPEGAQPAPGQWLDASTNKLHAMQPASGSALVRPQRTFEVRWTNTWSGTHEAQYIGGVNQNVLPANAYIETIVGVITGTTIEDIIIGDGSDTDRFVELTEGLTASTYSFALANQISDGTNRKLTVDPNANFTGSIAFTIRGFILE